MPVPEALLAADEPLRGDGRLLGPRGERRDAPRVVGVTGALRVERVVRIGERRALRGHADHPALGLDERRADREAGVHQRSSRQMERGCGK